MSFTALDIEIEIARMRQEALRASGPAEASCRDDLPGRRESPSPEAESPAAACAERLTKSAGYDGTGARGVGEDGPASADPTPMPESSEEDRGSVVPGGLRELGRKNGEKASTRDQGVIRNDADALEDPAKRASSSDIPRRRDAELLLAWCRSL